MKKHHRRDAPLHSNDGVPRPTSPRGTGRLGAGASPRPPSSDVAARSSKIPLRSVIQQLRARSAVGNAFDRVLWVGHSFGAMLSWTEVSRYHDVDGVIVTGALHKVSQSFVQNALATACMPANLDPHFAGLGLDTGYLTTISGTRGNLLYFAPTADRRVVAVDKANKDTVTFAELDTGLPLIQASPPDTSQSRLIGVPVLNVIGRRDADFCAADAADCSGLDSVQHVEAPHSSPQAQLRIVVVPGTGHAPHRPALVRRRARMDATPLPGQLDRHAEHDLASTSVDRCIRWPVCAA